ncbi:MAG: hypothetical protein JO060_11240 [Candidatus Eremiobacteraeota bacterium]|nr:hypothetical protein [Candidatus Eremiobacteraeota bacterium]
MHTGDVTFLFTDIEGSTRRWEHDAAAMQAAVRRHDEVLRVAIEEHEGYIFKTIGDAFCAAFGSAQSAVAAAVHAQRTLAAEDFSAVADLRVRMALYSGRCDERDGDYFGPAVNRVARLLAVGHGGQVLASQSVRDEADDAMPPGVSWIDLGRHLLKDVARPESVYQLRIPNLQSDFAPLRSVDALRDNLPKHLSSFVGRDDEVAAIRALVQSHRLVTVVGTGGIGKTRCALAAGASLLDAYDGGVWFVELASLSEAGLVAGAIASALAVDASLGTPLDAVIRHLKGRKTLIILDNCEHMLEEAARCVEAILHACADVSVIATSRERLGAQDETVYRLPPLGVPPKKAGVTADEIRGFPAIALFERRAESGGRFRLDDANATTVAEICRQLDGIALAIELAAARVRTLPLAAVAQKLDERFSLLKERRPTALPRHQTLRAVIDWSYDLLSAQEQRVFERLSYFAGSPTLEVVSSVCSDSPLDGHTEDAIAEDDVLDYVSSLVDKSLVELESRDDDVRYGLLDSTRRYGREKLAERGDVPRTAARHATSLLDLAEHFESIHPETPDRELHAGMAPELDDWRLALQWSLAEGNDPSSGKRLAGALRFAWTNAAEEGLRWVRLALERTDDGDPINVVARLHLTEAYLAESNARAQETYDAATRARERFCAIGDRYGVAWADDLIGLGLVRMGRFDDAAAALRRSLETARSIGADKLTGYALQDLAFARQLDGNLAAARELHAESVRVFERTGDERAAAVAVQYLSDLEFRAGNVELALRLATEARDANRRVGRWRAAAEDGCNITALLIALDRYDEAAEKARESLTITRNLTEPYLTALALQHLVAIAALRCVDGPIPRDDAEIAAQILGYVDIALKEYRSPGSLDVLERDRAEAALRTALGREALVTSMRGGALWDERRALAEGSRLASRIRPVRLSERSP